MNSEGDGSEVLAVADEGFRFLCWSDGSTDNPRQDRNVAEPIYIEALGAQRVMVGFPTSGGWRKDPIMCVMPLNWLYMPIGEVDGQVTARTLEVASVLRRMGKKVQVRRDIDAWLVTHVPAVVVFLGVYAADLDAERFGRTRDAILLGVRARAESFRAQEAAGIPVSPRLFKLLPMVPEPIAVAIVRSMAGTRFFEVGVLGHARVARDEMVYMLEQYRERITSGGVPAPTLDLMIEHVKGARPLLPDGSRTMPMSWKGGEKTGENVTATKFGEDTEYRGG